MAEDIDGGDYSIDFTDALNGFDRLGKADELVREGMKQSAAIATQAYSQAAASTKQYETQLGAILTETRQSGAATQAFAGQVAGLVKEIRDSAAAQDAARRALAAGNDERRKANALAKEAAKAEKQAAREAKLAADAAAQAAKDAQGFFSKLIDKFSAKQSSGNLFGGLLTSATAATGGFFAFSAISDKVREGLNDFAAISGVQATLKALTGSAAAGAAEFVYIKAKSDELGLSLIPTAKAYTGLFAAAKEANIPVAQTRAIFEGVTGAAKVLNLTADDTNGVLLALQQIVSKGTVASEELRGQIGERLPGAFGIAAKAMGLTTAELGKQLQAGKVLASDFLPKFAAQLKATYGDATAEAATQVGSNLGRINTYFANSSARLGQLFAPAIAAFADFVSGSKTTAQAAQSSTDAYFRQVAATKALVPGIQKLLNGYDSLSTMSGRSVTEQKELESTIQKLAKAVPGAVTEFDKYGKALGINSEAVRDFIKTQENLTRYLGTDARKKNREDLVRLINDQEYYQKQVALLNKTQQETGLRQLPKGGTAGGQVIYYTKEETAKIIAKAGEELARIQQDIDANLENRQRLRGKSPLLPTGDDAANDKAIEGLIKKQEDLIKALKLRQLAATSENAGNGADFLFGKGGLNKQLEEAQKELDRLQGKVDKSAKARESKLLAAEKALAEAREALAGKAAGAAIKEADDARTRSRLQFEEDLRQIAILRAKLIEKEQAVRRAGGRGNNADGLIDGVQQQQLDALAAKAAADRLDRDYADARKRTDYTLSLRAESDEKERTLLLRKYEADRLLANDNEEAKYLLKAKYLRDAAALEFSINKRNSEAEAAYNRDNASRVVGEVYGAGTGISVIDAKRAEKEKLLEIEAKAAQDQINNAANLEDKLKKGEIEAGLARLARVKNQLNELEQEKAKHKGEDFIYKLLFGESDSEQLRAQFEQTAAQVIGTINQILSAQLAAENEKVAQRESNITDLQSQLAAEIQLNKDGAASNIAGIRKQIEEEKAAKREALAESRRIQRQQQLVNDLAAVSSIGLAVANIIAGWSAIPLAGSILGIAAAAATVAGFIATKATAGSAARTKDSFFVGGYTGDGDARQVSTAVGARPYEYHKREFVMNHELTDQYRLALLEPLHRGRPQDINWRDPQMAALLPDYALPGQLQQERQAGIIYQNSLSSAPLEAKLDAVRQELAHIRGTNQRMADAPTPTALPDGGVLLTYANGSTHIINME
jgi:tape measure domain-containing protein